MRNVDNKPRNLPWHWEINDDVKINSGEKEQPSDNSRSKKFPSNYQFTK